MCKMINLLCTVVFLIYRFLKLSGFSADCLCRSGNSSFSFRKLLFGICIILSTAVPLFSTERTYPPSVLIVNFAPADSDFLPDAVERIGHIMENIQTFYRSEMKRNGFGPLTFQIDRNKNGLIKVHFVKGARKSLEYGRTDSTVIRNEVKKALEKENIFIDQNYTVIFQRLLIRNGDKTTEIGPFVGGGSHLSGTAWVYDDARISAKQLSSKAPGGWYGGPCSIGKFNTYYIGGTAHEMGHMFGLPHDCQRDVESNILGRSLMGAGNQTYGEDLRGEGKGTFLSAASAVRLANCRAFNGELPFNRVRPNWDFRALHAEFQTSKRSTQLLLTGQIETDIPMTALIAYNDDTSVNADYDAKTWTTYPDRKGNFRILIDELKQTKYQLRLTGVFKNGATLSIALPYTVGKQPSGSDLAEINGYIPEQLERRLFQSWNVERIRELVKDFSRSESNVSIELKRKTSHLLNLMSQPVEPIDPSFVDSNVKSFDLSNAHFFIETTGWGRALKKIVPEDVFISLNGNFYESGLYAHAPSRYCTRLGSKWKQFQFGYGLQDGHAGSVVFVVLADGREIFRSDLIQDTKLHKNTIDISGVEELELTVEPGGNGNGGDWAIWIEPTLTR